MISDLYSSLNVSHPARQEEGLEFMVANDADTNHSFNLQDFEDIFVQHLSTGGTTGHKLFLDSTTYATRAPGTGGVRANQGPTTTYRSPQRVVSNTTA